MITAKFSHYFLKASLVFILIGCSPKSSYEVIYQAGLKQVQPNKVILRENKQGLTVVISDQKTFDTRLNFSKVEELVESYNSDSLALPPRDMPTFIVKKDDGLEVHVMPQTELYDQLSTIISNLSNQ